MTNDNRSFILPRKDKKYTFDTKTRKHTGTKRFKEELKRINTKFYSAEKSFRALAVHEHVIQNGQTKTCMDCGKTIYMGSYVTVDRWHIKGRPKTYLYCMDCAEGIIGALDHVDTDYINYGVYPYNSFLDFQKTDYTAVDDFLDVLFQLRETNSRFIKLV